MIFIFLVPIALLLIGLFDLPTGYYTFLRIVVCLVSCLSSYWSYKSDDRVGFATVIFAAMALLFNPFIPVYLNDKDTWTVFDLIAAILFAVRYVSMRERL